MAGILRFSKSLKKKSPTKTAVTKFVGDGVLEVDSPDWLCDSLVLLTASMYLVQAPDEYLYVAHLLRICANLHHCDTGDIIYLRQVSGLPTHPKDGRTLFSRITSKVEKVERCLHTRKTFSTRIVMFEELLHHSTSRMSFATWQSEIFASWAKNLYR